MTKTDLIPESAMIFALILDNLNRMGYPLGREFKEFDVDPQNNGS
jgi:hypothetical protein